MAEKNWRQDCFESIGKDGVDRSLLIRQIDAVAGMIDYHFQCLRPSERSRLFEICHALTTDKIEHQSLQWLTIFANKWAGNSKNPMLFFEIVDAIVAAIGNT